MTAGAAIPAAIPAARPPAGRQSEPGASPRL
jgi:hypothetical protein